jgi:hypothetical protein
MHHCCVTPNSHFSHPKPRLLFHCRVVAHLRYGDGLASPEMVCSTAFDRDDEFFATAGVSRHVKVRPLCCRCMRPLVQRMAARHCSQLRAVCTNSAPDSVCSVLLILHSAEGV